MKRTLLVRYASALAALWLTLSLGLTPAHGAPRPSLVMKDLDGVEHNLTDYRGKWVVLNFWATWCPPCLEELPDLVGFHNANPDDVVLGINFEEIEPKYLRAFVEQEQISFPVLPIGDHVLPGLEPITGLPTTIILNPDGDVIAKHTGPLTRRMLEDFLTAERRAAQGRQAAK